jgi:HD-GYP domain-containing protein (c-di-GMP phosphodiesterase class II)
LRRLSLGALLHDVGKLSIPRRLLSKPGALTAAERNLVRRHTVVGSSILEAVALPDLDLAGEMARSHHERWDGGGYPDGLGGDEIPWAARIMAVVDVYDALLRPRAYRAALEEGDAIAVLRRGAGSQFDAEVLASFLDLDPAFRRADPRPAVAFPRAARTPHSSAGRYRNQPRRQK